MNDAVNETIDTGYQRPRDPVEIWLARQWQCILGFAVGIRENFFGVGGNSLDAARVIDAILVEFGVQLPLNVLTEHPTVERLATLLRGHAEPMSGPVVAIADGDGTRPPLFLVHPGNGQVGPYCRLAYALGEEFAVSGIQAAGLYSDAEPRRTVPAMADAYIDAIRAERSTGPYLLGGCGIGAAIAYEIAVRLDDVRLLAAIDAELLEPPDPITESWSHEPPRQPDLPRILASWQERDLVPQNVEPDFVARSLCVWRANREAMRDWRPSPYTGSIDTFGLPPIAALPATVVQLTHECGTDGRLAGAFRKLIDLPAMTTTEAGRTRRRRVRLAPMRSIPVEFAGERAGEGPLTLAQLNIYTWLMEAPDHFYATLCAELPVPAVVSVDDVAEAAAVLIARHESLRTTYLPGDQPRQRVAASGVQLLEVFSLSDGQWGPRDRPVVAEALVRWLRESPDPVRRPLRVAAAIAPDAGDRVIACAAAFSHLAVDQGAIEILKRDFAELLGDPARRKVGRPGHQPLDQAELEATPAERRRADAALAYLREQSWRVPRYLYALPGARASGESLAVELSSAAAAVALRQVAARTRTSRSAVVLAAICAVIARRANYQELVLTLSSSDRFERHLANYVGTLAQSALATVEITGGSFDELVRHTWMRVLEANRHARYDNAKRDAMERRIEHERGLLRLNYESFFNNLVPESWSALSAGVGFQPEEIDVAIAATELRWRPMQVSGAPIQFTLNQVDACLRLDVWSADTGRVPRAEMESLLLAVERLLVAAAHGDVAAGLLPELIGMEPIAGTPDRILVDSCWVDVADVQRLLDEAVAPAIARVFASADGRPLVAHLAATDVVHTPEQAHARCMTALAHHPTAITPRHYVICPTAPSDPDDPAAWPPPLTAGTGRAETTK